VAILSPELVPVGAGVEGEIAVRGPNVMRCYFKNPEATAAALTADGWLRTGDLGRMDSDGYVFVTGRLEELIIKGGENIAPREVDEALHAHPDVVEAAAFARPCARYGETVEAAVKLKARSTASEEEPRALCVARLGRSRAPTGSTCWASSRRGHRARSRGSSCANGPMPAPRRSRWRIPADAGGGRERAPGGAGVRRKKHINGRTT
jgi:hypothetical protein